MNIDLRTLVIHQVLLTMMLLMVVLMTKSIFENTFEIKNSKKMFYQVKEKGKSKHTAIFSKGLRQPHSILPVPTPS